MPNDTCLKETILVLVSYICEYTACKHAALVVFESPIDDLTKQKHKVISKRALLKK